MVHDIVAGLFGETIYHFVAILFQFYIIWLPLLSGVIFWELWVRYVQLNFNVNIKRVLLELRPPRDVFKSPLAMEIVISSLALGQREGTFLGRFYKGQTRPYSSLELVSHGGQVHFYIWTETFMKNFIESQVYSQYPGAEVFEVDDYVKDIVYDKNKNDLWASEYEFTNKSNVYPIKTYIDYGLDKDQEEESKIDPLSAVVEFLGNIKKGEEVWIQIPLRLHKKEKRMGFFSAKTDWKEEANKELDKIRGDLKNKESGAERRPTKGETDKIAAIEREVSKVAFDCGIRALYIAPKELFSKDTRSGIDGTIKLFNSEALNGFKNGYDSDFTSAPWQDYKGIRVHRRKKTILDSYKKRDFFFPPYKKKTLIMNVEELATIFHLPGQVASTPTLQRIPSKKAQAPTNLPV